MDWNDLLARNGVRSVLILSAFAIAQLNDVGKICNLVGGVFQVITFIIITFFVFCYYHILVLSLLFVVVIFYLIDNSK
jgi:hypothetical protein